MCGIVGYLGDKPAYDILINGLKRLEYRGYDSAGVALVDKEGDLKVFKHQGKVAALEDACKGQACEGTCGIAHTRWATHGVPNDVNAHPHLSGDNQLAIVHNGTIENYHILKEVLLKRGYEFKSDTDTEVLVQLIEYVRTTNNCSLDAAVRKALRQVVGAYAIVVAENGNPDMLVAARKASPLAIGIGDNETFLASDATPIVGHTNKVVYLADDEIAIIRRGKPLEITNINDDSHPKLDIQELKLSVEQLEKGGYETFMLKEIFQQPETLTDCMRGRIVNGGERVMLSGVEFNKDKFKRAERVIIVACGTSWHAGLIGKRLLQDFCGMPIEVEYASEFRYSNPYITDRDIVIAISQSGETADTLAAVQLAKERGAFVYGICNVVGASIPRETHSGTYIHVGPEIGVASTKAFTGQVTVLTLLALAIGQLRGNITPEKMREVSTELKDIPKVIAEVLKLSDSIKQLSGVFTYARNFIYLGRGYNYPTALEGALKLKEISYIHAEGYPAAEMKHGPIALIDNDMPSVIIAPYDSLYDKVVSNIQQVKSRGGHVVAVTTPGNSEIHDMADFVIEIPKVNEHLTPMVTSVPLQLLAYYIARNKGRDVDQPRNLAKSVTVE